MSHWRRFAQTSTADSFAHGEIYKLKNTVKKLQQKQNKANDKHPLEMAVLQSVQQQELA